MQQNTWCICESVKTNDIYDDRKCDKVHGVFCESESGKTNETYHDRKCDKLHGAQNVVSRPMVGRWVGM